MSLYVIIAVLIIAVAFEASLATLVTGAGTLILGLSWLIGGSLQEVLTSIIFLFVKHPFDVGDRVVLKGDTYTVKEIRLLSTIFLDSDSGLVQAPNNQLNTLFIQNIRRSPQMSETFTFDVGYSTTFEDLERLRERMLEFVTKERRDYDTVFDVKVKDFPDQEKMTLSADIKYKSNGQQVALKAKRRNKWICALKTILGELKIYGPTGDPNPPPPISRYAKVPWDIIEAEDRKAALEKTLLPVDDQRSSRDWKLDDKNAALLNSADDVFGESAELQLTNPRRGLSNINVGETGGTGQAQPVRVVQQAPPHAADVFEMHTRP
jgi:small-conductance mechanosensitive channel